MATQAYVFVYATPGKVEEAGKAIAEIEGVKSARACWGRPDVALCQIVLQKGQRALGVKATDTRLLVEM